VNDHSHRFCPHCGYDLQLDGAVLINDFSMMGPMAPLWWGEQVVKLTSAERMICYTLMKAYPSPVRISVLLDRVDSESDDNLIAVYLSRIRKKLREAGAPMPITSSRGRYENRGYVWDCTV